MGQEDERLFVVVDSEGHSGNTGYAGRRKGGHHVEDRVFVQWNVCAGGLTIPESYQSAVARNVVGVLETAFAMKDQSTASVRTGQHSTDRAGDAQQVNRQDAERERREERGEKRIVPPSDRG
ncbi:MAG: hypothetical protein H6682_22785 [Candidatus Eisenbacteria bacterium]|nr:hypothetical protein [Candidatus Eisenbacteria bacterium]